MRPGTFSEVFLKQKPHRESIGLLAVCQRGPSWQPCHSFLEVIRVRRAARKN
jgi:hypothetical protein